MSLRDAECGSLIFSLHNKSTVSDIDSFSHKIRRISFSDLVVVSAFCLPCLLDTLFITHYFFLLLLLLFY
jgi:hypothetical protein